MNIILKSEELEITGIKKRTQAHMFKDLKVGDKIRLSIPVKAAGGHRGTYASYIQVENIKTKETVHKSFNELPDILNKFELKVV